MTNDVITNNINYNEINIKKLNFGFAPDECTSETNMMYSICIHAIKEIELFNNKQIDNIMNIINSLNYG